MESVGPLAQRLEQRTHNPLVEGSNPSGPTRFLNGPLTSRSPQSLISSVFAFRLRSVNSRYVPDSSSLAFFSSAGGNSTDSIQND